MINDFKNIELNLKEKKEFFSSFASLYESGMPIGDVLKSILNSSRNEKIRCLCAYASDRINEGKTLDEALYPFHSSIGKAYSALIAAGEEAGKLENILSNICFNITKQQELKSNLITALIYPCCMFFFATLVGMIFMFIVFPSLRSITDYENISTSSIYIRGIIKIIISYIVIFGIIIFTIKTPKILKLIKRIIFSIWIIRGILTNYYFTNFFYIMSLAYEAGITPSKSIMLANSVMDIEKIQTKINQAEKMTESGTSVSRAFNLIGVFSGYAISQVATGEEAGKLGKMYNIIAKDYKNQTDTAIKAILKLIGPIVLLIVGIIVTIIASKGYSEYYNAIYSMI